MAEPLVGDEEEENLLAVLHSGRYVQGEYVREFEERWAEACDTDHAIAVTNGTAALHLALEALGVGDGDEVAVPALSFGATAEAVYHAGGEPVFVDVEEATHTISPDDLRRVAEERDLRAAIPVHFYGHPADMDRIVDLSREFGFDVIEDGAQAHGAALDGRPVGGLGDVGCFSFYATKNITSGEGGMITTDDEEIAASCRSMRSHGMSGRDEHERLGWNYRMSELHAAIGAAQVEKLDRYNERRRENSLFLRDRLAEVPWLEPLERRGNVTHAWFWAPFATRTDGGYLNGKETFTRLKEHGVECRHRYVRPLTDQPAFSASDRRKVPTARRVAGNVIGLPNHPGLDRSALETVVERIESADVRSRP